MTPAIDGSSHVPLKRMLIGLVVPVFLIFPVPGWADVITFEQLAIPRLDTGGLQVEGAFQYQATVGTGWEVQASFGNPASALATNFNVEGSELGDIVEIKLAGGGTFSFVSVDFRTILGSNSDRVSITGFLAGKATDNLNLDTSELAFKKTASGFSGPIDLLRVMITFDSDNNALILDNFTFADVAQIPEPSSLALVLAGALFAFRRRKPR